MLHRTQTHPRSLQNVGAHDARLRHVCSRTKIQLFRFVHQSGKNFGIEQLCAAKNFESVHAFLFRPAHIFARNFWRINLPFVPASARRDIHVNARRYDFILGAAFAFLERPIYAIHRTRITNRSHTMRHPKFIDIFRWSPLRQTADVRVTIHKPGQHIHPARINFFCTFGRTRVVADSNFRIANATNFADAIIFNQNVHRPLRRRSRPINDRSATNHQPLKRPLAFITSTIWRGRDGGTLWLCLYKGRHATQAEKQ